MSVAPGVFNVLPLNRVTAKLPLATILDNKIIVNLIFPICMSAANPAVASIMASSLGTVTQGPCVPLIIFPWATVKFKVVCGGMIVIDENSFATCMYGGIIKPIAPTITVAMP
jgi:hypothetical protein